MFDALSRTGFELELLAPSGGSRRDLAAALAEKFNGTVRYGLKYASPGVDARTGLAACWLTLACKVSDRAGRSIATLVDDFTIQDDLDLAAVAKDSVIVTDDIRLAGWLERHADAATSAPVDLLGRFMSDFTVVAENTPEGTVLRDPWGLVLATVRGMGSERERVCEVVTAPLGRVERREVVDAILGEARALGFVAPVEAALHLHLDGAPWQSVGALCSLISAYSRRRDELLAAWQPNPRCRRLGPFSATVQRIADEAPAGLQFATLAAALDVATSHKGFDLNIQGLVQRWPRQPTLEVRCLPMVLDPLVFWRKVAEVENFLEENFIA